LQRRITISRAPASDADWRALPEISPKHPAFGVGNGGIYKEPSFVLANPLSTSLEIAFRKPA
jgi:hypothetical protein